MSGIKNKNSGIYAIRHLPSGKCYVGSSVNLRVRKNEHYASLRRNKHYNLHLQRAFNKYGEKNFEWILLEEVCDSGRLAIMEKCWILSIKSNQSKFGYNATDEPYAPMRGKHFSKNTIEAMKLRRAGEKHPNAIVSDKDAERMFILAGSGLSQGEIGKIIGTCQSNVSVILGGKGRIRRRFKKRYNNNSGCVGVYYHVNGKWVAEIIRNKKYTNLGSFTDKKDAIAARKAAERKYDGI